MWKKNCMTGSQSNQAHILITKATKAIILDSLHKLEFCKIRFWLMKKKMYKKVLLKIPAGYRLETANCVHFSLGKVNCNPKLKSLFNIQLKIRLLQYVLQNSSWNAIGILGGIRIHHEIFMNSNQHCRWLCL